MIGDVVAPRLTLAELRVGDQARIDCIDESCDLCPRLQNLGLLPESRVCVLREALWGDPMTVSVGDQVLSLRRTDARGIEVSRID